MIVQNMRRESNTKYDWQCVSFIYLLTYFILYSSDPY